MGKIWALCIFVGTLAWGQTPQSTPRAAQPAPAPAANQAKLPTQDESASVPDTAAVITINGVCATPAKPPAAKAAAAKPTTGTKSASTADCKTVITKAQFEKLASGLSPNGSLNPQLKGRLASQMPTLIAMSTQAKKQHMDQTEQYKETLKFVQMEILASELQRKLQSEAADVPEADIQQYYNDHKADFEQYNVDRLFVPRTKQPQPNLKDEGDNNAKPTEEEVKAKQAAERAKAEAAEQDMTKLADDLHARAAAGEDFKKLQKEAFEAAGMKIESPTVNLANVRRTGLAPGHAAVFDLKPGEVSQVISDAGGHYIYKMNSNAEMPLDQVKNEIHSRLQGERIREMMDKLNGSYKVERNEAYFGPAGAPGGMPPRPMGARPGSVPPPAAAPQQAPAAAKESSSQH